FQQLQASKLWDKYGALVRQSRQNQLDELKTVCGIDVVTDLDSVIVSGDSTFEENSILLLIKGKWDEAKANTCFSKMVEKNGGRQLAISKQGKLTRYSISGGEDVYAYWIGDTVLVSPDHLEEMSRL